MEQSKEKSFTALQTVTCNSFNFLVIKTPQTFTYLSLFSCQLLAESLWSVLVTGISRNAQVKNNTSNLQELFSLHLFLIREH